MDGSRLDDPRALSESGSRAGGELDPNESNGDDEEVGEQIRISLSLADSCKDRSLEVLSEPLAVPASIGRKGLSAVINHLLGRKLESDENDPNAEDAGLLPSIEFDFIIGGLSGGTRSRQLLRTGVEKEARRAGLNLEEAVEIEYFPAQDAPESVGESDTQPDWISGISFADAETGRDSVPSSQSVFSVASYDGFLRLFRPSGSSAASSDSDGGDQSCFVLQPVVQPLRAHKGPIKCIDSLSVSTAEKAARTWIATGSMDQSLAVHCCNEDSSTSWEFGTKFHCVDGHSSSIGCVNLYHSSDSIQLASGDWDGGVCVWEITARDGGLNPANDEDNEDLPTFKKKKTGPEAEQRTRLDTQSTAITPSISIKAHTTKVSGISFGNHHRRWHHQGHENSSRDILTPARLITGSWDHSLKLWDVERQDCLLTLNGSRVVSCLDTSYHTPNMVATGTVVRSI
jgi:ribosome biogenesis protein